MIDLSRHIELLLLDHDCVIVPELGAFIANNASACYNDAGDSMFLPPYRNICFNQNLVSNDGLLVQAYMNAYDTAYPEALKQMRQDIADTMRELDIRGRYELANIGVLHKGINGNITFSSVNSGILTPSLYGLYSFCAKSWEEVLKEKQIRRTLNDTLVVPIQAKTSLETEAEKDNANTAGRRRSKIIDISVAAVASVLLFFLFSYPAHKSSSVNDVDNTLIASSPIMSNACETKIVNKIAEEVDTEQSVLDLSEYKQEIIEQEKVEMTTIAEPIIEKNFVIVLATCVAENNAMALIENLRNDGYSDVVFDDSGKMNRVTYSSFHTFKEASEELSLLRNLSPHFKEAWVYNRNK